MVWHAAHHVVYSSHELASSEDTLCFTLLVQRDVILSLGLLLAREPWTSLGRRWLQGSQTNLEAFVSARTGIPAIDNGWKPL